MPPPVSRPLAGIDGPATRAALDHVRSVWPHERWATTRVVIGCSGGGDSVALAWVLAQIQVLAKTPPSNLILAHFDHGLRPSADIDVERELVSALACRFGCSTDFGRVTEPPSDPSESRLRELRYAFFDSVMRRHGARYLALAHSSDDQAETIFQRLLRGTGLHGLSAMPTFRPWGDDWVVVRPMLGLTRDQLRTLLTEWNQPFLDDATNNDPRWTRNWLRNSIFPQLRERFPDPAGALRRLSEQATENQQAIQIWAQRWLDNRVAAKTPGSFTISLEPWEDIPSIVLIEALRLVYRDHQLPEADMSSEKWRLLERHCRLRQTWKADFPGPVHVEVDNATVRFTQKK